MAKLCGYPGTINCNFAPACGVPPFPPCGWAFACRFPGNLPCNQPQVHSGPAIPVGFGQIDIQPNFNINMPPPNVEQPLSVFQGTGIQVAVPAIPDLNAASQCRQVSDNEGAFYECMLTNAMPEKYRIGKDCLDNSNDLVEAYFCTRQDSQSRQAYEDYKQIRDCSGRAQDSTDMAMCVGSPFLTPKQRRYLACVQQNQGQPDAMAVCALCDGLNPEQAVVVSCAVSTGGQPHAFVVCSAGRLAAVEIQKCWQGGIGTQGGCFGPNSEFRKLSTKLDNEARKAMGDSSEAYHAFRAMEDLTLPGPDNRVVGFLNNSIDNIRKGGVSQNNEIVKVTNGVGQGLNSVARGINKSLFHH